VSAAAAQASAAPKAAAYYVGMGSSYASAPGVGRRAPGSPAQCLQSDSNYAHLFATQRHLSLNDQSCSGATTESMLARWRGLPAQMDAVGPATRLVTITVGGNDVDFVGDLYAWSCRNAPGRFGRRGPGACKQTPNVPNDAAWTQLAHNFQAVVAGIHQRSPRAEVVFVDYPTLVPAHGACPNQLPLTPGELATARAMAVRASRCHATGSPRNGRATDCRRRSDRRAQRLLRRSRDEWPGFSCLRHGVRADPLSRGEMHER